MRVFIQVQDPTECLFGLKHFTVSEVENFMLLISLLHNQWLEGVSR